MSAFKNNILAFVLAGGRGERLYPLTAERTKPSVPFGGKYRIIDFTLSNLVNSGIYSIYVLVQYKSQSLIEHVRTSWRKFGALPKHFITIVPPQMRRDEINPWYRGTADSVFHNINLIYDFKPKFVAIFGGDHVYRMNIKEMLESHMKNKAQLTIAAIPAEAKDAYQFGVIETDATLLVKKFQEKMPISESKTIFASMGNYIFDSDFLLETLSQCQTSEAGLDFGRDIIPQLIKEKKKVFAYDFSHNRIPSLKKYESKYYWKDVGSLTSYWQANMDLLGDRPKFDLDNNRWPIYASNLDCPPTYFSGGKLENSVVCEGTRIFNSVVKNSIIGRSVIIEEGCHIEDSIVMDFSHIKKTCRIKKTIIDRYNVIPKKISIGYNKDTDAGNYYRDNSGITVLKRGLRNI